MSKCKRCTREESPPVVQGMKLDLPRNWACVSVLAHPSRSFILCADCIGRLNDDFMTELQSA
jgi:hypothetical protein